MTQNIFHFIDSNDSESLFYIKTVIEYDKLNELVSEYKEQNAEDYNYIDLVEFLKVYDKELEWFEKLLEVEF